jgi:hypothetical protein
MEAGAVMVFVSRCDYSDAASNDMAIALFQPLYFTFDRNAHGLRRIGSFKSHLQWDLHQKSFGDREFPDDNSPATHRGIFHRPVRTVASARLEHKNSVLKTIRVSSCRNAPPPSSRHSKRAKNLTRLPWAGR